MTVRTPLLQSFVPDTSFAGKVSTRVRAAPERIFDALRRVTTDDMPVAKFLGDLRYLPKKLAHGAREPSPPRPPPFLDELARNRTRVLAEAPNAELVLGTIGKFHRIDDQAFVAFEGAEGFLRFENPSYQKLAMSVRVEDAGPEACTLVLEHRTQALGEASRRAFARYWVVIHPMGNLVSWLLLRAVKRLAESERQAEPPAHDSTGAK